MIEGNQSTFIPGRVLLDGFMVFQECISAAHKDGKRAVVIKLDFSKAYDNVRWDFFLLDLSWFQAQLDPDVISILFVYLSGFQIQSFEDDIPDIPSLFEDIMIGGKEISTFRNNSLEGGGELVTEYSPEGLNVHVAFVSGEAPH
ncbi:hypothetical protein QJS10_CPA09g00910 [Acorus calamus]|uniref:Reverse transcriptase domain-containing protein n=1 Tax=Acorus calamus TaxID=4465 RepID=A0AAV9E8G2_ACOCL|nr:hypothetical protein QJS10_CPA09g00910 [Acorus calamus]